MSIADVQTTPAVSLAYVNHTCRTSLLRGNYRGIPKKKTQLRGLERFPALRWIHGVAPESNSLAPARPPCKNMNTSTALQCDSVMFIGPKGDHLQESHVSHFEDTLRRTKSPSWWYWNANYCQHVCGPKPYVSIRSHKFGTPAPTCQC